MNDKIQIKNALRDEGMFSKEHIFIASIYGVEIRRGCIYPYYNKSLNPEHPFNIYMEIDLDACDPDNEGNDLLYEKLVKSAESVVNSQSEISRIYFSVKKEDIKKKLWLEEKGMQAEAGTLQMSMDLEKIKVKTLVSSEIIDVDKNDSENLDLFTAGYIKTFSEMKTRKWIQGLISEGAKLFILKIDESLVGALLIMCKENYGLIDTVYITDEYKHKGYGNNLMNYAHSYFNERGLKTVKLEVWGANLRAKEFYDKIGYKVIDTISYSVGRTYNKKRS